ncbi:MAG TPA: glycosyltransferase, partial [Candidatus Binataceae bacterium]|nr:glycosyltransferase [Candidatus Binataceae bacterium]
VTTLKNGAAERIRDGANGLLIDDPENIDALAAQMRRLLDPQERKRIGNAARETTVRYDLRDNFGQVERILADVAVKLRERRRPSSMPQCEPSACYDEASVA